LLVLWPSNSTDSQFLGFNLLLADRSCIANEIYGFGQLFVVQFVDLWASEDAIVEVVRQSGPKHAFRAHCTVPVLGAVFRLIVIGALSTCFPGPGFVCQVGIGSEMRNTCAELKDQYRVPH
jgi:hypothetical protein